MNNDATDDRASPAGETRLLLAAGGTETAAITGISAAGADPDLLAHTPSADAEILVYGEPVRAPVVPVSPSGCPTPAVVTRAVRERLGFGVTVVDAGLRAPTAAPTVDVGAAPGGDVRDPEPVPDATAVFERAREFGRGLPAERLLVAETIPGGTTTALGVLAALGERETVSSSLQSNPLEVKRRVVEAGLDASDLSREDAAGNPVRAVRLMGDPVLAVVAGVVAGAAESGRATEGGAPVGLAGGTQMLAAAALARHAGIDAPLSLTTTAYVERDPTAALQGVAADLDVDVTTTDPGFGSSDHPAMARFTDGEAKEGVGMGGALALADRAGLNRAAVREGVREVYDRLFDGHKSGRHPGQGMADGALEAEAVEPAAPEEFGLVQVWWGDGKGKTTAALGMATRAVGHGYRVHLLQLMKGGTGTVEDVRGEYNAIAALPGFTYENSGHYGWHGFHDGTDDDEHAARAQGGFARANELVDAAREADLSTPFDPDAPADEGVHMLVIDELLYAANRGLVDPDEVREFVASKPEDLELVLTGGHDRPEYVTGEADLVTNVRKETHPIEAGQGARKGTEY